MERDILEDVQAVCNEAIGGININIEEMLRLAVDRGASDLHITVPYPPSIRVNGVILPVDNAPPVTPEDATRIFEVITTEASGGPLPSSSSWILCATCPDWLDLESMPVYSKVA